MLINRYTVYRDDIEPLGLEVISIDGAITDETVRDVRQLLENPARVEAMTAHNAEIAKEHFSYEVLQTHLENLLASFR
jgi:glycosyltransferase involved in cell wall biosynthesis